MMFIQRVKGIHISKINENIGIISELFIEIWKVFSNFFFEEYVHILRSDFTPI